MNRDVPVVACIVLSCIGATLIALNGCGGNSSPAPAPTPPANTSSTSDEPTVENPPTKTPSHSTVSAPSSSPSAIHFTDVTAESGIDMTITCGVLPATEILEVNGGGLALIDIDKDGDLDLFVANGATMDDPQHGPGCRLYENIGGMRFRDVTARAGINIHRWANGVAVGDYDGDGRDDLYVTCYGPNILLHNDGDAQFSDVTATAGVAYDAWGTSAAFGDVDGDGDLDLYVCNYLDFDVKRRPPHARSKGIEVMAGPMGLKPQRDVLYENLGDGTLRDITEAAGCGPAHAKPSYGLNVVICDFDNDGRQDITVANDSMPGFYFHNVGPVDGQVRFEEIGVISGLAANADGTNQSAMGLAIADVDGNGLPDKFTTVFSSDANALHMNLNGLLFEDRSQQYGLGMISRPFLGWSCGFFDFDHDGDEDLLMVNGHVYPQATMQTMDSEYQQPPLLFERDGRRFKRVMPDQAGAWLGESHRDRNAAFADLDGDGDIDMIVGELNGPIRVVRNDCIANDSTPGTSSSHWLTVELSDDRAESRNRRGLGAKIELIASPPGNASKQTRWIFTGGGFQSSGASYAHFGIPSETKSVSLTVTWPDGEVQRVGGVHVAQHLTISRP